MRPVRWLAWLGYLALALAQEEVDSEESRKVLGSSVVTSVSVIMDHGNGTKTYIADAAGQPVHQTEGPVGSPGDLLSPDRYEFYTFDESGDLVKKLMTLEQIKSLIAGGDGEGVDSAASSPTFYHESLPGEHLDDPDMEPGMMQGVHNVVQSVQNVLRSQLEATKIRPATSKPALSIPDSASSWSILFPAILGDPAESPDGNSDVHNLDNKEERPSATEMKNEIKSPTDKITTSQDDHLESKRPTPVPPIIHFLQIQSIEAPEKNHSIVSTEKTLASSTVSSLVTIPSTESIINVTVTTNKPTSPARPITVIEEMAASISSLLSQVTDDTLPSLTITNETHMKDEISSPQTTTLEMTSQSTTSASVKPTTEKQTNKNNSSTQLEPATSNIVSLRERPPVNTTTNASVTTEISSSPERISTTNITESSSTTTFSSTTPETLRDDFSSISSYPVASSTPFSQPKPPVIKKNTSSSTSSPTSEKPPCVKIETSTATHEATTTIATTEATTPVTSLASKIAASSTIHHVHTSPVLSSTTPSIETKHEFVLMSNTLLPSFASTHVTPTAVITTTKPSIYIKEGVKDEESLEAHSSEERVQVVTNNQSETFKPVIVIKNKTRPNTVPPIIKNKPKPSAANLVQSNRPTKPVKTPPKPVSSISNKPHTEQSNERILIKNVTSPNKNQGKINVSAVEEKPSSNSSSNSSNNDATNSSIQLVKITSKPTVSDNIKLPGSKINPTQEVKITTYKPSTNQPFTTKPSTIRISSTTAHPAVISDKEPSSSQIHETNTTLVKVGIEQTNYNDLLINKTNDNSSKTNMNVTKFGTSSATLNSTSVNQTTDGTTPSSSGNNKITSPEASSVTASEKEDVSTASIKSESVNHSELTTTELAETTTFDIPDMDVVKEGISAVTNILLDQKHKIDPQLPMPALTLSGTMSDVPSPVQGELKHASHEDFDITTTGMAEETEQYLASTTEHEEEYTTEFIEEEIAKLVPEVNRTNSSNLNVVHNDKHSLLLQRPEGSSNNYTDSSNSSEQNMESATEVEVTTPDIEEGTTLTYNPTTITSERNEAILTNLTMNNLTAPTKESKLNPEEMTLNETDANSVILSNTTGNNIAATLAKNDTNSTTADDVKEVLESAQSVISTSNETAIPNKSNESETSSLPPETATTPKSTTAAVTENNDFKTAVRPDPPKYTTQNKFPAVQNGYRPLPETPINPPTAVELHPAPHESMGLEATTAFLADDVRRFSDLCNELAFRMWTSITGKGSISSRSLVLSPFAATSLLAMVFLGARGPTSGQMNDVLRLDDMVTFNPHQVLQNVTESVLNSRNYGVATAAFVRELYSDKLKGKILDFYKERAQQYYDGHVEEIAFNAVGDILRRRTNLLVKRQTLGRVPEYLRGSSLNLRPPLAAFSANIFQTDCELASTEGRDGEMYFVVRPSTRQRRLVPVPAAVWRAGFLAGYEPGLDATGVALGAESVVSTILILPGQQGQVAPGDGLARLEQRLIETSYRRGGWTRLMRSLLPRPGLELQVPRFSHRSVLNVTGALQRMGLKDLFNEDRADLRGLNGLSNDLHLSDIVQVNTFSTCGEETIGARHHIETYPMSPQRMGREDPEIFPHLDLEDFEDQDIFQIPLALRPRQARLPDNPRLRFDRPFLYMIRHNPTGMILHMGRFNPRLIP